MVINGYSLFPLGCLPEGKYRLMTITVIYIFIYS